MKNNQSIINSQSSLNSHSSIINNQLKVVFFGTPSFTDPVLKVLKENFNVIAEIRDPKQIVNNQSSIVNSADLFVVAAYGQILSKELLEIPRLGAINIHPSLLPKYRGPSPIQSAILNGDKTTGVSFIKMDDQIDHGPIIEQLEEEILTSDTFETLASKLFEKSAEEIQQVVKQYIDDQIGTPQDDSEATFTKIVTKQDGFIDATKPPGKEKIDRMIRAYFPWPGAHTKYQIQDIKYKIIKLLPDDQLQVEGKRPMSYKDFINGYEKASELLKKLNLI